MAAPYASLASRGVALAIAGCMMGQGMPAFAGPPADEPAAAPATAGGTVALLKFTGPGGDAMRYGVQAALAENGYTVVGVRASFEDSAAKVKCKAADKSCIGSVTDYLVQNTRQPITHYAYGIASNDPAATSTVVVVDVKTKAIVVEMNYTHSDDDLILPIALPRDLGARLLNSQLPLPPMSDDEKAKIAALDEPEQTPEEIAADKRELEEKRKRALEGYNQNLDAGEQKVDLRAEFKDFCRNGPREDKVTKLEDGTELVERDPRPACKRGPVFGYFRPRSWIMGGLAVTAGLATIAMYSIALVNRGKWSDAKDELDASGLSPSDPTTADEYARLAGQVSSAGDKVGGFALGGDIALGATLLLGVVFAITVGQDRKLAKSELAREKEMRISDLRIGPTLARGGAGIGAGFRF